MNAVFFDCDGTLFDTRADLAATVNHARADLGLAPRPPGEIIAHVGLGARHLLANAIPERSDDADMLWNMFRDRYGEHMLETVRPYPGAERALESLREGGWLLGINTAKPAFATHAILEHFGFDRFFGNAVVAGGDCPEMKPSAAPLLECASRMGGHAVTSADWMVGDNWTDMQCAANAGVRAAFCSFGFGRLADSRYDAMIDSLEELVPLLCAPAKGPGKKGL